jgi:hypothetical protein
MSVVGIQGIPKDERERLQLLPVVTMWINNGTNLTELEVRSMARLHPKEFEYAKKTPVAEMLRIAYSYKGNRLYHDLITIILSEKGRKWVERTVGLCKKIEL